MFVEKLFHVYQEKEGTGDAGSGGSGGTGNPAPAPSPAPNPSPTPTPTPAPSPAPASEQTISIEQYRTLEKQFKGMQGILKKLNILDPEGGVKQDNIDAYANYMTEQQQQQEQQERDASFYQTKYKELTNTNTAQTEQIGKLQNTIREAGIRQQFDSLFSANFRPKQAENGGVTAADLIFSQAIRPHLKFEKAPNQDDPTVGVWHVIDGEGNQRFNKETNKATTLGEFIGEVTRDPLFSSMIDPLNYDNGTGLTGASGGVGGVGKTWEQEMQGMFGSMGTKHVATTSN